MRNTKTMVHFEKDIDNAKKYACFLEKCGFIIQEFMYCESVDAYRITFYDAEEDD